MALPVTSLHGLAQGCRSGVGVRHARAGGAGVSPLRIGPRPRPHRLRKGGAVVAASEEERDSFLKEDPERKARRLRIFPNFAGGIPAFNVHKLSPTEKRKKDQLAELALLNERLAGKSQMECAEARKRLEWLKVKRNNWSKIYHTLTKVDAAVTLEGIEEANRKVNHVLSDEERDKKSVGALRDELLELQVEVREANKKLQYAQMRVQQNLYAIEELRDEAVALEALKDQVCSDCREETCGTETPKWEDLYQ